MIIHKDKLPLKKRFLLVLSIQIALTLLLWFCYHFIALSTIERHATENADLAANAILQQISDEFHSMKQASAIIAGSTSVQDFLCEQDVNAYYKRAIAVSEVIDKIVYPLSTSDSLITIDSEGDYYRFSGSMSNETCNWLYDTFKNSASVFTIVELEGSQYFCHSCPVLSTKEQLPKRIGNIIMLTSLAKTRRLLEAGNGSDIDTAIILHEKVLLSSPSILEGSNVDALESLYSTVIVSDITGTGLQIATAVRKDAADTAGKIFLIISLAMISLFMLTISLMNRYLLTGMIRPMSGILQHVSTINDGKGRLPATGNSEFDELVNGVNAMLDRTEQYHMSLLNRQIDTHFIVNSLASIQALAERGEIEKTQHATAGLAYLLKHMHADAPVNIFVEMEALELYISLMNIRHNDKFRVEYEVDDCLAAYRIPSVILQPIVENALTHGLQNKSTNCCLMITGKLDYDKVIFTVADNGVGILPEQLTIIQQNLSLTYDEALPSPKLRGVALTNIQKRIQLLYGTDFGIEINSVPHVGTTIIACLPAMLDDSE